MASKFSMIVLGGTAASHTCSGVGGGHFLIRKPCRGIEPNSAGRINLSAVRLRLLFPDSAAGAFFLFFGAFTLAMC